MCRLVYGLVCMQNLVQCFPWSRLFRNESLDRGLSLKDPGHGGRHFPYTERHLQAVWFDSRWRPVDLVTGDGESVSVEFPGKWNTGAGPDFLGATLTIGPQERRITGDVEVHIFPADWRHHGHRDDTRYRNVILHVTYFAGGLADSDLPSGAVQIALQPLLKADASFAFEHIDIAAYPYACRADVPPCRTALGVWPVSAKARLLDAAGHERLRVKAERTMEAVRDRGIDQVFYETFMTCLGYHHNKHAFHELSQRMPLNRLQALSRRDEVRAYALLAGASGLLPSDIREEWDEETRKFVRRLWDIWWKERTRLPEPMQTSTWRLSGIRPLNHPVRRMAAASRLFTLGKDARPILSEWYDAGPEAVITRMAASTALPESHYWARRTRFGGVPGRVAAVLGRDRLEGIALNCVIPLFAALDFEPVSVRRVLDQIRPEPENAIIRDTSHYLFGPDAPSSLIASANRRQGLMQIFHDYCLHDRSRCSRCPLPARLRSMDPASAT